MKTLVASLVLGFALTSSLARPVRADVLGASWILAVTPLVVQSVLDLQDAWSCYVEGFRRRHPSPAPRPVVPRPDSLPRAPVPATAPSNVPPLSPSLIAPVES